MKYTVSVSVHRCCFRVFGNLIWWMTAKNIWYWDWYCTSMSDFFPPKYQCQQRPQRWLVGWALLQVDKLHFQNRKFWVSVDPYNKVCIISKVEHQDGGPPTCIFQGQYQPLKIKEADNKYVGKILICSKKENPHDKILGHPVKEWASVQVTQVLFLTKTLRYFTCVFPFSATLYSLSTTFI